MIPTVQSDVWQQPWMLEVLQLPVTGPDAELTTQVAVAAAVVLLCLPVRRGDRRLFWNPVFWLWLVVGACAGALLGMAMVLVADEWLGLVPMRLPWGARVWVTGAATVIGLVVINVLCARWWRKVIATLLLVPVLAATAVGVNAEYGILRNVGELLGRPTSLFSGVDDLPPAAGGRVLSPGDWVARHWRTPATMPTAGRRLTIPIPAPESGFEARPAQVYLPPAALVTDAPVLPVVVLMMGQPGTPDVSHIADELDRKSADRHGLAPIVVVADQIGDPLHDTLCMDTTQYGKVETYINTDVVTWIKQHLRVSPHRADWVVAGYSNGGLCSARFLARHHDIWGNALDISGEWFPGSDHPGQTLATYFGGDQQAYSKEYAPALFEGQKLEDTWFIGSVSMNDNEHRPGARRVCHAVRAAGGHVTYLEFAGGGHGVDTLRQGLEQGLAVLYPRLGLDERIRPADAGSLSENFIPEWNEQ